MRAVVLACLLLAALRGSRCQDLDNVVGNSLFAEAARGMTSDSGGAMATEAWLQLEEAVDSLWSDIFPELLKQEEDLRYSNFTPECVLSAIVVYKHDGKVIPFLNRSIPLPGPLLLPMLDAMGKPGAGVLGGNTMLDGAYDECFSLNYTGFCLAQKIDYAGLPQNPFGFTVGLCVPKGCSAQDVSFVINSIPEFSTEESNVFCSDTRTPEYSVGAKVMIAVCSVFAFLVVVGTLIDCSVTNLPKLLRKEVDEDDYVINDGSINTDEESTEKSPLMKNGAVTKRAEFQTATEKKKKRVSPLDFITAFSLFETVPTLLATKQAPGVITSLNGLRVISMFWVILGHTHFWIFTAQSARVDNFPYTLDVMARFSFQAVGAGFFSVDSFFFLSGVLVAYLTLRQMKKRKGRFPFLSFYIHRILRLTPTYMFVLFFAWFLTQHLGAVGPILSLKDGFGPACKKYWWTNLLYINNFYPWNLMDGCISWTWYLANDMQFYIISPLILIPVYFLFPVGLLVTVVISVVSFVVTAALTIAYDLQGNQFSFIAYNYSGHVTTNMNYSSLVYIKPWGRIAPYLVGLMLGYIFYRNFKLTKLSRKVQLLVYTIMWVLAGVTMFWLLYGLYFNWHHHIPGRFENTVYITFSRFLWGMGLALIVFACHNGYGWFVNSFLSMSMWTPLSRMTFNAYLVHPVVMSVIYGQLQTTIHYSDVTMAAFTIVFVVLSFGVASMVCLLVEFPLSTVEMLLFKMCGLTGRESQNRKLVNIPKEDHPVNNKV